MTKSSPARVHVILGTMGIPSPMTKEITAEALKAFSAAGHNEIDTAIVYQGGQTEKILGEVGVSNFKVACKVNPWFQDGGENINPVSNKGGLEPSLLKKQLRMSLESLKQTKTSLVYLHAPDQVTPIGETLLAMRDLFQEGLFEEWGVSNFVAWQVVDICHRCKELDMPCPAVYQGMYNAVTRSVEKELIPALRQFNMRFYAYNPLAGGVLTGKWKLEDKPETGRFSVNTVWGNMYRDRYWQPVMFAALEKLKAVCAQHDITMTQASLRWTVHHSALSAAAGDGVIIGGSTLAHVTENVSALGEGPLPQEIVDVFDLAWNASKGECPSYFK